MHGLAFHFGGRTVKQQPTFVLAAVGLISLNPLLAQSTATMEHASDHHGYVYQQGEPIRIEFSAGKEWSNKPLDWVQVDFAPEHQGDSGFSIGCDSPLTVTAEGLVTCNTKLVPQIMSGRYHMADVQMRPHGTLGKVLPLTSGSIAIDGLDRELQELLDHTQLSNPEISPERTAGATISPGVTLTPGTKIQ